jgi:hypothetical protein
MWSFGRFIEQLQSEDLDMKPSQRHLPSTNLTSTDRGRTLNSAVRKWQLTIFFGAIAPSGPGAPDLRGF